ncbi:hypothetical protein AMATHDRAFT_50958 [Amanita thiersii Skay4041]|uniref:Uncharacterized protein n=1 Tax=Amanita thiersii Skay4041 TaxID=703135 RepID=A0A2A9N9B6_9AGAR|nr:hypothetical protein AMATHDRAFT_50958 [Amanita thiersii Skay4041]
MAERHVLLQYGDDPFDMKLMDLEGRVACTVARINHFFISAVRLTREASWAQQHPKITGPDYSYFYLGPDNSPGYITYGNGAIHIPMSFYLREGSASRYFRSLSGKDYKWRKSPTGMECIDNERIIAIWEISHSDDDHFAKLTISADGMLIVTEILTTLTLNLMAKVLDWNLK